MCCEATEALDLPAEVIETLAHYRRLRDQRAWDWGDEGVEFFSLMRFAQLPSLVAEFAASGNFAKALASAVGYDVLEESAATGNWAKTLAAAIGDDVPAGVVVIRVDEGGGLRAATGPPRSAIPGRLTTIDVVADSAADADLVLTVAGRTLRLAPKGGAVQTIGVDGADPVLEVVLDGEVLRVHDAVRPSGAAELHLRSSRCVRWSVIDASGGAWFPEGVLAKWDFHHRPFFHGHDLRLAVPADALAVACTRGLEYERVELAVTPASGKTISVNCDPVRIFDPPAEGWYGGDLHVHMNYSGDLVCTPAEAARMQLGEGLHLLNLVAANCLTSLVYDRDMLEQFCGTHLPWSTQEAVAQMGVEYRNDLLGHVHALGPSAPPSRYYTGHERSDHPEDWPPNRVGCEELRALGSTVGYCHPVATPFPEDGSTRRFFRNPRSVEARELVADAALGLIDSVDLISPSSDEGAVFLYHRLLGCGLRLAATAGTDTFLSFSHSATFSNPPGWGRVYAYLGEEALSVEAFKQAIRAGRTLVTNGPWIRLVVNGQGPGSVLDLARGERLEVMASVEGLGAERLSLVGPDGVLAEGHPGSELYFETGLDAGATWIAAVARGAAHLNTLDRSVLAHTTPVYVDVAGKRVARAADARWCLEFLDTLEAFVGEHGHFDPATRHAHLGDVVAVVNEARSFYRRVLESADN
jgi:hypothetical protein